jgi:hypothetical protein
MITRGHVGEAYGGAEVVVAVPKRSAYHAHLYAIDIRQPADPTAQRLGRQR